MRSEETTNEPLPADELAFRWRGSRPALNFTATVGERWRRAFERLREPADLARWFHEAGLSEARITVTTGDLAGGRLLRESLYRAFTAVRTSRPVEPADLAVINQWAARPVAGPQLEPVDASLRLRPPVTDAAGLLSLVARDGVDLLAGPLADRIRECARDDCALLFVDESRAGGRRWCSMDACGARSKMSAYRRRRPSVSAP